MHNCRMGLEPGRFGVSKGIVNSSLLYGQGQHKGARTRDHVFPAETRHISTLHGCVASASSAEHLPIAIDQPGNADRDEQIGPPARNLTQLDRMTRLEMQRRSHGNLPSVRLSERI
jgi:hypothetical protein